MNKRNKSDSQASQSKEELRDSTHEILEQEETQDTDKISSSKADSLLSSEENEDVTEKEEEQISKTDKPNQQAIPQIDTNAPLKFEENQKDEEISDLERRDKRIFIFGGIAFTVIIILTISIIYYIITSSTK